MFWYYRYSKSPVATPTLVLTLFWGSFLSSSHHRSTKQGETRLSQSQNTKYPLFSLASLRSYFELKLASTLNKTRRDEVVKKSEYHTSAFLISQSEIIFRAGWPGGRLTIVTRRLCAALKGIFVPGVVLKIFVTGVERKDNPQLVRRLWAPH